MSVQNTPTAAGATQVPETTGGVYASLFEKINLHPVDALDDIDAWQDSQRLADASADERVTAAVRVFLERLKQSGQQVEKLDKTLLDHHIAELDRQISRQLDTVMHHPEFQQVESLWRGLKHLVNRTDYPGVNSSWHLAWQAPDGRVLNYTLRTEAGEGPLALLRLRHFTLPDNIFIASASDATHDDNVGDDEPSL